MGMNDTPLGERVHIGFFGRRNAGKSSLVNAVTGQELAVVSDTKGTTTDPVRKAMELLPMGPVLIIDTPGFDDEGSLGELRVRKTRQILNKTDVAVLVADVQEGLKTCDQELLELFRAKEIPYVIAWNKSDLLKEIPEAGEQEIYVSAQEHFQIWELKEKIAHLGQTSAEQKKLVRDLLHPGDVVVLVIPIDTAAPKGRLILPQQQVIRDVLEGGGIPVVCRETELKEALAGLTNPPKLVITDSQAFEQVSKDTPKEIPLTSFSILMARYKGDLKTQVDGARAIENLKDGDKILISEGCTHHRQCGDIGTQKLPKWISGYCGKNLEFCFTSGTEFPEDLSEYAMVVHCGGCMLPLREMRYRISYGGKEGVPITNYGVMIAYIHRILQRVIQPFREI